MLEYGPARVAEEPALLDFANMVFSLSHEPTDFKALQPFIYGQPGFSKWTQVAREEGRILGMICTPDGKLKAGQESLQFGYIGTVSAHPYERGRGIMKELMRHTLDTARAKGLDFLALGGQRQRYQHFGFEDSGAKTSLYITQGSIAHSLGKNQVKDYRFVKAADAGADDVRQALMRHQAGQLVCERAEQDFPLILRNWGGQGLMVYDAEHFLGYLYVNNNSVDEFAFLHAVSIPEILLAYLQTVRRDGLSLSLRPFELSRHKDLFACADSWSLSPSCMIRVFHWQAFLQTLLRLKASHQALQDGKRVLEIQGEGKYLIQVLGSDVTVKETAHQADMTLDPLDAVRVTTQALSGDLYPKHPFYDWFPLPFDIPAADAF
ncbi:MAG: GNAT family N-acetyltransferase [Clostridiales bacterium]|nr:GNAT family N-acetyltransferase [Clostridiales bacterium]